jgi:hypothetical protein
LTLKAIRAASASAIRPATEAIPAVAIAFTAIRAASAVPVVAVAAGIRAPTAIVFETVMGTIAVLVRRPGAAVTTAAALLRRAILLLLLLAGPLRDEFVDFHGLQLELRGHFLHHRLVEQIQDGFHFQGKMDAKPQCDRRNGGRKGQSGYENCVFHWGYLFFLFMFGDAAEPSFPFWKASAVLRPVFAASRRRNDGPGKQVGPLVPYCDWVLLSAAANSAANVFSASVVL